MGVSPAWPTRLLCTNLSAGARLAMAAPFQIMDSIKGTKLSFKKRIPLKTPISKIRVLVFFFFSIFPDLHWRHITACLLKCALCTGARQFLRTTEADFGSFMLPAYQKVCVVIANRSSLLELLPVQTLEW